MSVFSALPHDLIREIVKEADGGITTHKKKFQATLDNLNHGGDAITGYEKEGERRFQPIFLHEWGQSNKTGLYGYDVEEDCDHEWMTRQDELFGWEYGYGQQDDEYPEDDYEGYYWCVEIPLVGGDIYEGLSKTRAKRIASSTGFKLKRWWWKDGDCSCGVEIGDRVGGFVGLAFLFGQD